MGRYPALLTLVDQLQLAILEQQQVLQTSPQGEGEKEVHQPSVFTDFHDMSRFKVQLRTSGPPMLARSIRGDIIDYV